VRVNDAVVERLERVIESLQDNSVKMGQMLAVHDEKLDKQDRIDAVLFEKVESVHREVNRRALISFIVSPVGQKVIRPLLTPVPASVIVEPTV